MTLKQFEIECDRRETYLDEKLANLEKAVEELALTMDRVYNNTYTRRNENGN